jgi:hypothetical protein
MYCMMTFNPAITPASSVTDLNKTTDESADESTDESTDEPTDEPTDESTDESTVKYVDSSTVECDSSTVEIDLPVKIDLPVEIDLLVECDSFTTLCAQALESTHGYNSTSDSIQYTEYEVRSDYYQAYEQELAKFKGVENIESTSSDMSSTIISVDAPKLKKNWQCVNCNTKTLYGIRYCGTCWNFRKNWAPQHRISKKKHKRFTLNQKCITPLNTDQLCTICCAQKKDTGFIHGTIAHQMCCYSCAKKCYVTKKLCPMCNGKIEKIVRIIMG